MLYVRSILVSCLLGFAACSTSVSPAEPGSALYFTELPEGTCGEIEPVRESKDVCKDFGGAVEVSDVYVRCAAGPSAVLWFSPEKRTGSFLLQLDDCLSSYDVSETPNTVLPGEALVHDHR